MRSGIFALLLATALFSACKGNMHNNYHYPKPPFSNAVHLRPNIGLDMATVQGFTLAPVKLPAATAPQYAPMSGDCITSNGSTQGTQTAGCINLYALSTTGVIPVVLFDVAQQPHNNSGPSGTTGSTGPNCCNNNGGQSIVPQTIYNVGKFVLFVYPNPLQTDAGLCGMVILRKSDGALFCSKDGIVSCGTMSGCMGATSMDRLVQAAADIDIVYAMRMDQALLRFDFSNPASAVATVLIDQSDGMVGPFNVSAGGDALVSFSTTNSNIADLRYYKHTNGFSTLQALSTQGSGGPNGGALCTFAGPGTANTDFFAVTPSYNSWNNTANQLPPSLSARVLRIRMDPATQQVTYTTYAADPGSTWNQNPGAWCGSSYQGNTSDRHFIFWLGPNSIPVLFEAVNPSGVPVAHTITGFSNVTRMFTCSSQVVLAGRNPAGNDIIVRYDPVTTGTQTVLSSSDYTISQVDVSDGCDITFGGRRSSDNSRIIGNIPAGSTNVSVYTNALDGDVKQLVRIR